MIASFGGEIKRSFSKNTAYLLAGKNADTKKIKGAQERQVEIINLRRLEQLLLGRATIEAIRKLDRLTKASFKGDAYEVAGEMSAASQGESSEAEAIVTGATGAVVTTTGASSVATTG